MNIGEFHYSHLQMKKHQTLAYRACFLASNNAQKFWMQCSICHCCRYLKVSNVWIFFCTLTAARATRCLGFIYYFLWDSQLSVQTIHKPKKKRTEEVGESLFSIRRVLRLDTAQLCHLIQRQTSLHVAMRFQLFHSCFHYASCFGFESKRSNNNCTNCVASMLSSCAPMHCWLCLWYSKGISSWHIH